MVIWRRVSCSRRFASRTFVIIIVICTLWLLLLNKFYYRFNNLDVNTKQAKVTSKPQESTMSPFNIDIIRRKIIAANEQQIIRNQHRFNALKSDEPVLIVQVHNRVEYLKSLIDSLRRVRYIENSLVIFSHDVYLDEINRLVKSIEFCKVQQIFYPNSMQLNPTQFPGPDPNDCPRNVKPEEAAAIGCINAKNPDSYGHYREAKYSQTKHHWFWKINYIFDYLNSTRNHSGPFIFLEEDHYLVPDILHVLDKMTEFRRKYCLNCDLMTLGSYARSVNYGRKGDKLDIQRWISSQHNMGIVLYRSTWYKIRQCSKEFCQYDDYNWDWSLQHISLNCLPSPFYTLMVTASRIFHIGDCGVHHSDKDCTGSKLVEKVENIIHLSEKYLYPAELYLQRILRRSFKMPKVNGGWGDIRDHQLCMSFVIPSK